MSEMGLTPAQADTLFYIRRCLEDSNIAPSFEEIKDYLGLKSKSGVHRIVHALIERGHIYMLQHNKKRALAIGREPLRACFCPNCHKVITPQYHAVET